MYIDKQYRYQEYSEPESMSAAKACKLPSNILTKHEALPGAAEKNESSKR